MGKKFKVGQKVWILYWDNKKYCTKDAIITNTKLSNGYKYEIVFSNQHKSFGDDKYMYETEKEIIDNFGKHVFVSSKGCYASELKYFERQEKLNRILNG